MSTADRQTRRLLLSGFGGLLLLLALSGFTALSVLGNIQTQSERIREDYFHRDQILEELRSDIYLSGTYVRDLLLEQDPGRADSHRKGFEIARQRIQTNILAYQRILRDEERPPFQTFRAELESYFVSLRPALEWNALQRRAYGYDFMNRSLLPRRMTIVHLADQISSVNQRQMDQGDRQIASLFARFRGTLLAFLVLSLLCGGLLAVGSVRRILRLEQISAVRLTEAETAREALRDLSARLIEVQESERRSLSRELHDEVGQSLSALLLGIGNVAALISSASAEAAQAAGRSPDAEKEPRIPEESSGESVVRVSSVLRAQLNELRHLTEKTVAVVRDMSLLLRPSMLDDLGLISALQWQAREVSRNSDVFVQVHADPALEDLPDEHKTCVYRIVQEALRNIVRHANAKAVCVDLTRHAENLILTIRDDGRGFPPGREKRLGLLGMEERVTHLHGHFRLESAPGEGASIRVELPLAWNSQEVHA